MAKFPNNENPEPKNRSDQEVELSHIDDTGVFHFVLSPANVPAAHRALKVFVWKFLRNNGEYVQIGDPIVSFQMGEIIGTGLYMTTLPVTAKQSGILELVSYPKQLVKFEECIFKIHTKGEATFQKSYPIQYFFSRSRFNMVEAIKDKPLRIGTWFKEPGDKIEVGDVIATLTTEIVGDGCEVKIIASDFGFLDRSQYQTSAHYPIEGEMLFSLFENDSLRIERCFVNVSTVVVDPFDSKRTLHWIKVAGQNISTIESYNVNSSLQLNSGFVFEKPDNFILFEFKRQDIPLQKNDKVVFLFDDGISIQFSVENKSVKSSTRKGFYEVRCKIDIAHLLLFAEKDFKNWKVVLKKEMREIIGGFRGPQFNYNSHRNLVIVIRKLAQEHLRAIQDL